MARVVLEQLGVKVKSKDRVKGAAYHKGGTKCWWIDLLSGHSGINVWSKWFLYRVTSSRLSAQTLQYCFQDLLDHEGVLQQ